MRRRGTALVGVMVLLLVLMALGGTMLTSSKGTRRKLMNVERSFQRDLALDAAFVRAFHDLKEVKVGPGERVKGEPIPAGGGEVLGYQFSYTAVGDPETNTVRIDAVVTHPDDQAELKGAAVAHIHAEEDGRTILQTWSLRYHGPEHRP